MPPEVSVDVSGEPAPRAASVRCVEPVRSVAAINRVAPLAEAVREEDFHLLGLRERHRVEMFVEARHQPFAATTDDTRGFDAVLVILKALLRREAGHADV